MDRQRPSPTEAFTRHEHHDLRPGIERIRELALRAGHLALPELSDGVLRVLDWARDVLEPHASWEDAWLYPQIDERVGTPWATRTMRYEHGQVKRLIEDLRAARAQLVSASRPHDPAVVTGALFALDGLLRAHLEREDRFLVPLLDEGSTREVEAAATR
jgi:iron-sulfur cluster repair protein YtfE (RIC family)